MFLNVVTFRLSQFTLCKYDFREDPLKLQVSREETVYTPSKNHNISTSLALFEKHISQNSFFSSSMRTAV